jgi:hypothetical protein
MPGDNEVNQQEFRILTIEGVISLGLSLNFNFLPKCRAITSVVLVTSIIFAIYTLPEPTSQGM